MSEDPRRICVCGRQRSKEPVIITITTCKNNHGITTEGATVCVTSVSPQPEGSTDQTVVEKPANEPTNKPPPSSNENTQPIPQAPAGNDAITEDTGLPTDSNQIDTVEEINPAEEEEEVANDTDANITAAEDETDAPTEENPTTQQSEPSNLQEEGNTEEVDEFIEQENAEVQIEDEGLEPGIATEDNVDVEPSREETNLDANDGIDEDNPEEFVLSVSDEEVNKSQPDDVTDPTVMMLTETAVNTLPFLNRLFWTSDMPSTKPTASPQKIKECTLELIVLERHIGKCRHNLADLNSDRCIFDGESLITNCGRIDIPNETIFSETRIKKLAKAKASKIRHNNQEHPSTPTRYKSMLEILKTYFKNKQIYDNSNTKSASPFKQLQKYLTPPSDDECAAIITTTNDQSLQVGSTHISNKVSRWYDGFLMCIGLKAGESLYDVKGSKENLELQKESSSLMTKYLRI